MVAGRTVVVTSATSIDQERGPVATGACVEVQGTQNPDSSVQATEIEVKPGLGGCGMPGKGHDHDDDVEFRGVVQTKPASGNIGTWQISGRKVDVTGATVILPVGNPPGVGSCVLVQGTMPDTGNIAATRIQGQGHGACQQGTDDMDESKLIGNIETLPASGLVGDWKVAGNTVRASTTTVIDTDEGAAAVGVCAEVRGPRDASQVILATRIEIAPASECDHSGIEFSGVVESMPASGLIGLWKISSRPKVGACVAAALTFAARGQINAIVPCEVAGKTSTNVQGHDGRRRVQRTNRSGGTRGPGFVHSVHFRRRQRSGSQFQPPNQHILGERFHQSRTAGLGRRAVRDRFRHDECPLCQRRH